MGTGVWVWGPNTVPLACMSCGGCVPWGLWGAVPGGVACHRCEGRLLSGAVPPPAARPLERAARVPQPVCPGFGRCGRGDPEPAPQRAPLRASVACLLVAEGRPRGGACHRCGGRLVSGAVPPPAARPLERSARVPRPGVPGAVGAGLGTQHRSYSVRPCWPSCSLWWWRQGVPGGGCLPPL